ncbi:MAG TPA: nuclear transport factor 2 family protein [Candidatus Acidoferrales bacterium]|nr:nuclear transport factor 2 family protein [Candidatus Acidoferrales bacterium]
MTKRTGGFSWVRGFVYFLAAALVFAVSLDASAGQKQKKGKNKDADQSGQVPMPALPDVEQIDHDIGEMLAGFQLGDAEMMHQYYSDNVVFVSGAYEPPVVGWQNYVPLYQRERAAFQAMQLNRRNTLIFTRGDVAWASYQWRFDAMFNGQPYSRRGQTTLVFNKIGGNWLIVHNHTSEVTSASAPAQQAPAANPPASAQPKP